MTTYISYAGLIVCSLLATVMELPAQFAAGNAMHFPGTTNSYVRSVPTNVVATNFTVEAWLRPNTSTGHIAFLGTREITDSMFDAKLGNGNVIHGDIGNGTGFLTVNADTPLTYTIGTWYHVAYVVTPTNYTIYTNGLLAGSGSYTAAVPLLWNATNGFRVGNYGGGEPWNGDIDEVRVWRTARTAAQILANYPFRTVDTDTGLELVYHFDESSATNSVDSSGNGHTGNMNGTVSRVTSSAPIYPYAPAVTNLPATSITNTSAVLNAAVTPGGGTPIWFFRYGLTTNYGSTTIASNLTASGQSLTVTNLITGLSPVTTYHYQIAASNLAGISNGADLTFTSLPNPVSATTVAASGPTSNTVTLNATINPGGDTAGYYFQYGLTSGYGSYTATNVVGPGIGNSNVSFTLTGLTPAKVYHFAVVATNSVSAAAGNDLTFHTGGFTNIVSVTNDSGAGSLRDSVATGTSGDVITFAPGLAGKTVTLTNGQLTLDKNLTIDASLAGSMSINGNGSRVFLITNNASVTLTSLTITNGKSAGTNASGGGIYNSSNCVLMLSNCVIAGNTAIGSTNAVSAYGGGIFNAGSLTMTQSSVFGNSAVGATGSNGHGGSSYSPPSGSNQQGNPGANGQPGWNGSGGGLYNLGTVILSQDTFSSNSATGGIGGSGGGGGAGNGSLISGWNGGAAGTGGLGAGGALYNSGSAYIDRATFFANTVAGGTGGAGGPGGASGGSFGQSLGGDGRNGGDGGQGVGAAIYTLGSLSVSQSTLSGNVIVDSAGGTAGVGGSGGTNALLNGSNGRPGSSGLGHGAGVYNATNLTVTLQNSLVALNSSDTDPDLSGFFTSLGHNLVGISGTSTGLISGVNNDAVGTSAGPINPLLGPLANNGGPTPTLALLPGSPALDAGDDSVTNSTDQRGFARWSGPHVDIGAYELDTSTYLPPSIVSQNASGLVINPTTHLGSVTVSASINPNGLAATTWLRYGASTSYGNTITTIALGYGTTNVPVVLTLPGLAPGVTIHYQLVAVNGAGTTTGLDRTVNVSQVGDFNGDGTVSGTELNSVYGNYLSTSPFLMMTNVAGLGGTNVTFALNNAPAGTYSVQYSTDLINWTNLGPANPMFQFTDTNAPALPHRYYRLSYP